MLYPTDEEAGYPEPPVCPLCHQRCDTIYRTDDGTIVGCDRCWTTSRKRSAVALRWFIQSICRKDCAW